nr:hypothetical protein CFP56_44553 [Quercus suber]
MQLPRATFLDFSQAIRATKKQFPRLQLWVTRTRTRTLELLLYNLSQLRLSVHKFFLEAARVLEVARIRCFIVCQNV